MAPTRPRHVLLACGLIMVGSVLAVLTIAENLQKIGSLALTERFEKYLSDGAFSQLDLTLENLETAYKWAGMVAAACATACVILGWQALKQRSTTARLWLSILALPLFLAGNAAGGFGSTLAVVGIVMLWTQPARDWFAGTWKPTPEGDGRRVERPGTADGRPGRPAVGQPSQRPSPWGPPAGSAPQPAPQVTQQPTDPQSDPQGDSQGAPQTSPAQESQPRAITGWASADPAATSASTSVPGVHTSGTTLAPLPATYTGARPSAVVGAAVLTWIFSLLTFTVFATAAVVILSDPSWIMEELRKTNPDLMAREEVTENMVRGVFVFLTGVVLVWAGSACVLAFLLLRRITWARPVLLVCVGAAALMLVVATLTSAVMVVPLGAAIMTIALLCRREVGAWLAGR